MIEILSALRGRQYNEIPFLAYGEARIACAFTEAAKMLYVGSEQA